MSMDWHKRGLDQMIPTRQMAPPELIWIAPPAGVEATEMGNPSSEGYFALWETLLPAPHLFFHAHWISISLEGETLHVLALMPPCFEWRPRTSTKTLTANWHQCRGIPPGLGLTWPACAPVQLSRSISSYYNWISNLTRARAIKSTMFRDVDSIENPTHSLAGN